MIKKAESNDNILVIFGGRISVGNRFTEIEGIPTGIVGFQALETRHNVGDFTREAKKVGNQVLLIFEKSESIDVVIEHLQSIKRKLEDNL